MKILIAEDDDALRRLAERVLRRAGHEVASTRDGAQAAGLLGEAWDLLFTDLSMPGGIDGLELAHRARAGGPVDVILMTGHPDIDSAVGAVRGGVYDYLIKPFGPDALLAAAARCEEKRRLSAELERERRLRAELDRALGQLKSLKSLRESFGQFVTPEVVHFILENQALTGAAGRRRESSVLFADARGFTSFAETAQPEEVVALINELFAVVIDAVSAEGGIVNKFLGDGLMAVFGAPLPDDDHSMSAARAAARARDAVERLAAERMEAGLPFLRMGFGLDSGTLVAGCLGSRERAEYTVIGRAANLAKRLESAAEPGQILLGPGACAALSGRVEMSGGRLIVAGVDSPLDSAELRSVVSPAAS